MLFRGAATLVVVVHLAFVVFLLAGGFLAWRWPALLKVHVPAVLTSAALALAGLDCPLTDLEKWLRTQGGVPTYEDGFIAHYLVEPLTGGGITPTLRMGLRISTVAVVLLAYLGLVGVTQVRRLHRMEAHK